MIRSFALAAFVLGCTLPISSIAAAETREAYLNRLKDICAVECLKPRDFRRKARKRDAGLDEDMAVLMDVRTVRRVGDRYELLSMNLERSNLETLAILGSAGVNTSGRTGAGGLPRNARGNTHYDLIIIELDKEVLADFLDTPGLTQPPTGAGQSTKSNSPDIVVEGDRKEKRLKPSMAALDAYFMNRRIVVRGVPELTATWVGGRRDYRRKQVTLKVDNADDLALLPRYDDNGQPIAENAGKGG